MRRAGADGSSFGLASEPMPNAACKPIASQGGGGAQNAADISLPYVCILTVYIYSPETAAQETTACDGTHPSSIVHALEASRELFCPCRDLPHDPLRALRLIGASALLE